MTEFFYQTSYRELVHVLVLNKDGVLHVFYFIYNSTELTRQGVFHLAASGPAETELNRWASRRGFSWQKIDEKTFKTRRPAKYNSDSLSAGRVND